MGWATSIHIRTAEPEEVLRSLRSLAEHDCFIGRSGPDWTGIYSKRCQDSAGDQTPELTSRISEHLDRSALGICLYEDEFCFWFFGKGILLDTHPEKRRKRRTSAQREILNLANSIEGRKKIETALSGKRKRPFEVLGMTEQDFITQAYEDMARVQSMSLEERREMRQKYSLARSSPSEKLRLLCDAIGISRPDLNYSDLLKMDEKTALALGLQFRHLD